MNISTVRKSTMLNGRIVVHLSDCDGDTCFPHGIVICPARITTEDFALKAIDAALQGAKEASPDEWSYDEVIQALTDNGFEYISPVYWEETQRP